ncbi:Gfo/Idh/MocA family protein [Roseiflexus sp. RS-1]|jgi:1,5-anhydro-D-fructose reductase (1,5-anhydro-D-mannitol-forming)|uniref:Gfo/Idh/MocA family protein n=1 Tax=Roseiflexus sp. (strain RS-1) TaxID=357808 RepID=UPI0000D806D8|nr:Gfo/Idh/MocA family oxidoreductase [Roseiflexus sp. RS-1]ABQ89764.1 oxidoreductase domain protein [Roseiflexus sp. RS-1]
MIRVAMLSYWHVHAWDYTRQAQSHPDVTIGAVWDELPERGRAAAEQLGVPFYESLDDLLALPEIDAVIVDAPTSMHCDVMVAAARAGKHIFTEKVLAPTLAEANEIIAAADQASVVLTVSLPRLAEGYTQAITSLITDGACGDLTLVRIRMAHNGALRTEQNPDGWLPPHFYDPEQCRGGAMIDLGCHPMYLARHFLGLPETVNAHYGYVTGRAVEDNAVVTLGYASGALAVVEAGFVTPASPFTIEVHGTHTSLIYSAPPPVLRVRGLDDWIEQAIPKSSPLPFVQWVDHIQRGTRNTANIDAALDLTKLMEAANRSAAERRQVRLDSLQP